MSTNEHPAPKSPVTHLQIMNLVVALMAGLVTVAGGIYSLNAKWFAPKTGILEGVVRDEQIDKPLWKVPVEVTDREGAVVAAADSDQAGQFQIKSLPEGSYVVKVTAPRHGVGSKNIKIIPPSTTTVIFDLKPEPDPVSQGQSEIPVPPAQLTPPPYLPQRQIPAVAPPVSYSGSAQAPSQNYPIYSDQNQSDPYSNPAPSYHRRRHSRYPSDYSGEDQTASADQQPASQNSLLTQVVGQFLQSAITKKSDSTAVSDTSSASTDSSTTAS